MNKLRVIYSHCNENTLVGKVSLGQIVEHVIGKIGQNHADFQTIGNQLSKNGYRISDEPTRTEVYPNMVEIEHDFLQQIDSFCQVDNSCINELAGQIKSYQEAKSSDGRAVDMFFLKVCQTNQFIFSACHYQVKKIGEENIKLFRTYDQQNYSMRIDEIANVMMCVAQQSRSIFRASKDEWVYEHCSPNTVVQGKKVSSIIDFVLESSGFVHKPCNDEQIYDGYCSALKNKLQASEPYYADMKIAEKVKEVVFEKIKQILPQGDATSILMRAKNYLFNQLATQRNPNEISLEQQTDSDLASLRICLVNEGLELTPCYFKMTAQQKVKQGYVYNSTSSHLNVEYKQQKFVLSKFDIEQIVKKLPDQ